jgi:N-methylhydantoinase B/oxoprolinase/acetone carboxylase alpha subunit
MTPFTILYRLTTLISEGITCLPEAEQYTGDRKLFEAWLIRKWEQRTKAYAAQIAKDITRQTAAGEAIKAQVSELIKEIGYKKDNSPNPYRIKTPKESAEWWAQKRKQL